MFKQRMFEKRVIAKNRFMKIGRLSNLIFESNRASVLSNDTQTKMTQIHLLIIRLILNNAKVERSSVGKQRTFRTFDPVFCVFGQIVCF